MVPKPPEPSELEYVQGDLALVEEQHAEETCVPGLRETATDEKEDVKSRRRWAILKELRAFVILGIIGGIAYACQDRLSEAMFAFITAMEALPIIASLVVIFFINVIRKLFPPSYFFCPFGTATTVFIAIRLPLPMAVIAFEVINLHAVVVYPAVQCLYAGVLDRLCSPGDTVENDRTGRCLEYVLPRSLQRGIQAIDVAWLHHVKGTSWCRQVFTIIAWGSAEHMNDLVFMMWFACRTDTSWARWTVGHFVMFFTNSPKAAMRLRAYGGMARGVAGASSSDFLESWKSLTWYEVVAVIVFTGGSSVYVHGTNLLVVLRAMWLHIRGCCGAAPVEVDADSEGSVDEADPACEAGTAADRQEVSVANLPSNVQPARKIRENGGLCGCISQLL
eukprot:TRINITY_DN21883_c0_g2_i1.p1 TRINITY_DN21883_c0_g2~~TRINITY_DN21883_c0_g2_i1.p1  ORF type:complete len:391 (+),score=49.13 TRINITY_DN21883_c0_g2_i1:193-1365(+)